MIINKTLSNGVRVAIVPIPGLRAVTIEAMLKIGAKHEQPSEHGLSHFLEHMAFKGTKSRPGPMDIFREMDIRGADYNAETGLENTAYSITTVKSNLEWGVEMLADILFNSTMPEEEVNKERGVIAEEIKMYKDNPMMGMGSEMMKLIFGKSNVGCWNISGELENIVSVKREDIVNFRKRYFDTSRMVVVLAGNIEEKDIDLVEKYFGDKTESGVRLMVDIEESKEKVVVEHRQVEQGHFALAVPSYGWTSEFKYPMRLLDLILTGNSSSKLFEEIRSKRGWAYYVFSVSENVAETGMWGMQAGVSVKNIDKAIDLSVETILGMKESIVNEDLSRAKTFLKGRIELNLDQSEFWSGYVGEKWLLEGRLASPIDDLLAIEKVKTSQVKAVCAEIFKVENIRKMVVLAK